MSIQFVYHSPTTPGNPGFSINLGDQAVRLGDVPGLMTEAELGAVGTSSLRFDDPTATAGNADDAILGLKQLSVNASLAPSGNRRIGEYYIGDRRYYRGAQGSSPSLRTEAARIIDMTLVDINAFLSFRIFRADTDGSNTSFNRAAETDVARVTAMLAVSFISDTLFDGLVSTANPVDMDACDYTGQRPADVLNDCAQQSGKNFFVFYDESGTYTPSPGDYALFYDKNDTAAYVSTMKVSNVLADVDNSVTWAPLEDAILTRDPSRVVSGAFWQNGSNSVYVEEPTTSYKYGWRDAVFNSPNLKTETQATARATRYLTENATEDDRLTFTVRLPEAHVNDWKEGQAGMVRFSHLPGYETSRWVRALSRTVIQDEETDQFLKCRYEATPIALQTGFHQLVISGRYGVPATTNGTFVVEWRGSDVGGISQQTPPVVQDTDGFTGTPGNMQWGGPTITSWTIPANLGGRYTVGWETIHLNNAWWVLVGSPPPNPQSVPYVFGGEDTGCGAELADHASVTYTLRRNGTTIASSTALWPHTIFDGNFNGLQHLAPTPVVLADGDVLDMYITFAGGNFFNAFYQSYGIVDFGFQQGVFVMTRVDDS